MTKESEEKFVKLAEQVFRMRSEKKSLEDGLKTAEAELKTLMKAEGLGSAAANGYFAEVQSIAPSRVADTDLLKADGLFDKYSKIKAGYDKLIVKFAGAK